MRLPTRLDRYPAKMVSHLAESLISRYAADATRILDPFSGSGAILLAAHNQTIPATGIDVNPLAGLFAKVKIFGFDPLRARELAIRLFESARRRNRRERVNWDAKGYWFNPKTLAAYEYIRGAARDFDLLGSNDGIAILLSIALSIRPCSKADQRSPKPFISKEAAVSRGQRQFDPYTTSLTILTDLGRLYGTPKIDDGFSFLNHDITSKVELRTLVGEHSHVITSPPYANAQDYFRNFKLELHLLEGVLPFSVAAIRERFIGTERGDLLDGVSEEHLETARSSVRGLRQLERSDIRKSAIIHRYFYDMAHAFDACIACIRPGGVFVLVCGDNLVGGLRIRTWKVLSEMLEVRGLRMFDRFSDKICDRLLPPRRSGHKGLIKEEVVSAFRLSGST